MLEFNFDAAVEETTTTHGTTASVPTTHSATTGSAATTHSATTGSATTTHAPVIKNAPEPSMIESYFQCGYLLADSSLKIS